MSFSLAKIFEKSRQKIQKIEIIDGFVVDVKNPLPRDLEKIFGISRCYKVVDGDVVIVEDRKSYLKMLADFVIDWSGLTRDRFEQLVPGVELPDNITEIPFTISNCLTLLEESSVFENQLIVGLDRLARTNNERKNKIKKN